MKKRKNSETFQKYFWPLKWISAPPRNKDKDKRESREHLSNKIAYKNYAVSNSFTLPLIHYNTLRYEYNKKTI